jgi:hypothetical protein
MHRCFAKHPGWPRIRPIWYADRARNLPQRRVISKPLLKTRVRTAPSEGFNETQFYSVKGVIALVRDKVRMGGKDLDLQPAGFAEREYGCPLHP